MEHDKTNVTKELHKRGWETSQAYNLSRNLVQAAAKSESNQLNYFIDIHRDSARREITTKTINGVSYAKVYFVVGQANKNYLKNLETAKNLDAMLESKYPGISRGVFLKPKSQGNGVYNQDISNNAILLEVGGVDNTSKELERSIDVFSNILAEHYWKSNEAKEVNGDGDD